VTDRTESWLERYADLDCCDLTTTGRRTGRPHEIEIWFGVLDGALVMVSGNRERADWYLNLRADPRVTVRIGGEVHDGVARIVTDPDERRRIGEVMGAKYDYSDPSIGLTQQAWSYDVPAVVIELVERRRR
jgi:deazaflavin-dependent oxidoreductase (nitroreductase family)